MRFYLAKHFLGGSSADGEPCNLPRDSCSAAVSAAAHSAIIQGGMMQLIHMTMYDYVSGIKSKVSSRGFEILLKKFEILAGNLNLWAKYALFQQNPYSANVLHPILSKYWVPA